jgi:CubicO group peptidase (beta-lactamase class C family)
MSAIDVWNTRHVTVRYLLEEYVARGYATGMVALIARGEESTVVTVGDKASGAHDPMRRDTIFRIASMTKPIIAAATMMLVEDGKLRLHDPVDELLPELANRRVLKALDGEVDDTVPAVRPITVDDLLTFRLGLGMVLAPPGRFPIQTAIAELGLTGFGRMSVSVSHDPDEWMRRLGTLPLMAQPGEQWLYNIGSNVLGVLIARASGESLPAFLRSRIFGPLRMHDTAFFVPRERLERLSVAYSRRDGELVCYDDAANSDWRADPEFPEGAGGLVSTVDDYLAFSRCMLLRGRVGDRQLLSNASIAAMTSDHLTRVQRDTGAIILGRDRGWGYGLSVALQTTAEGVPAGAYGWVGSCGTSWAADPASDITAILMTQTLFERPDPPAVHKDFWRTVFASEGTPAR